MAYFQALGRARYSHRAFWLLSAALLGAAALLLLLPGADAQCSSGPPPNDCFASAIAIPASPYSVTPQSNAGAGMETGEPSPCGAIGSSIWYSWTPQYSGTGQIDTYGSGWDTAIAAYTGTSVSGLTNVGCNDDNPYPESMFTFTCVPGTTYMIQAGGFSSGTGTLHVNVSGCTNSPICSPSTFSAAPGTYTFSSVNGVQPLSWSVTGGVPSSQAPSSPGNSFTTSFATPGTYYVIVTDSTGQWTRCTVNIAIPGCGYTVMQGPQVYNYTEIDPAVGGGGTGISNQMYYTRSSLEPTGPAFDFKLCGTSYSSFWLAGAGYICMDTASTGTGNLQYYWSGAPSNCGTYYQAQSLPSGSNPNAAVYGQFSILNPSACAGGSTTCNFWKVEGTAPNRVIIYEFKDVPIYYYTPYQTFQIKLYEASDCVEVHYKDIGPSSSWPYYNNVAGYEDATGGAGFQFAFAPSYSMPGMTFTQTAWSACPFSAIGDAVTFNEDDGPQGINVTWNDNSGGTAFGIVSHTNATKGTVTGPFNGLLVYQPYSNANGADSFQYTISNGPSSSTARVSVTINPVNDVPAFESDGNTIITAPLDGEYVQAGWARAVVPGPQGAADEADQGIVFQLVGNSNPGIFAGPPTVQRTGSAVSTLAVDPPVSGRFGTLRFQPSGASGLSRVCFRLEDSGGAETATDSAGLDATGVNVTAPQCVDIIENEPPVAFFEASTAAASPGQAVTFDSCPRSGFDCSFDPDGYIALYMWDFGDGATSSDTNPTHRYTKAGLYEVRLTVKDDHGSSSSYLWTLRVGWVEAPTEEEVEGAGGLVPPVADAGENRTVPEMTFVQMEGRQRGGSESTTFAWTQVRGIPVSLADAKTAHPSFTTPRLPGGIPTDLMFSLRVSEGSLASAPDYLLLHVVSANHIPVAEAGPAQNALAGAVVVLDGSRSADADRDNLTFQWEQLSGPPVRLSDPTSPQPTFTAPASPVALEFRLRVFDGRAAGFDATTVVVDPQLAPAKSDDVKPDLAVPPKFATGSAAQLRWIPLLTSAAGMLGVTGVAVFFLVRRKP